MWGEIFAFLKIRFVDRPDPLPLMPDDKGGVVQPRDVHIWETVFFILPVTDILYLAGLGGEQDHPAPQKHMIRDLVELKRQGHDAVSMLPSIRSCSSSVEEDSTS